MKIIIMRKIYTQTKGFVFSLSFILMIITGMSSCSTHTALFKAPVEPKVIVSNENSITIPLEIYNENETITEASQPEKFALAPMLPMAYEKNTVHRNSFSKLVEKKATSLIMNSFEVKAVKGKH